MLCEGILICLYLIGEIITACPPVCNCDSYTRILSCHGWKDTRPPNVSNPDRFESLDLSSVGGAKYHEAECIDPIHVKATAGAPLSSLGEGGGEGAGAGGGLLLGDALQAGRLPASWLGVRRFMYLQRLRIRGAGLRLVHKDAFRYQLKLRCVDLSDNHLQRLNLFTWQRHDELNSLILAGNKDLHISADSPILYSKSLRKLDLSGCQLEFLHFCAFDGVPRLKKLDLSHNKLKGLSASTAFPHGLEYLNLSWNNMTYISSEIAECIMNISEVMLNNNPWKCDCQLMKTWEYVKNLTSEESFELMCFDRFSNQSWNEVFGNEPCEMFENTIPSSTTTEGATTAVIDNVVPAGEVEEATEVRNEETTENYIYLGEVNEIAHNQVIHVIMASTLILLAQLVLYFSIWRKLKGRKAEGNYRQTGTDENQGEPLVDFEVSTVVQPAVLRTTSSSLRMCS